MSNCKTVVVNVFGQDYFAIYHYHKGLLNIRRYNADALQHEIVRQAKVLEVDNFGDWLRDALNEEHPTIDKIEDDYEVGQRKISHEEVVENDDALTSWIAQYLIDNHGELFQ